MKRYILIFIFMFFSGLTMTVFSQTADAIVGKWYNTEKDAQIEIFKVENKFFGKIIWLQDPKDDTGKPKVDLNNSDVSKQQRPIIGLKILDNFKFNGGTWEDGTIYDPKNGKTYSCIIKEKDNNTLEVRGYIGISLIGRTVEWTKAE
ncbi:DUF2147 domain-containing protein [Aquiflexum lacus]|uniref:DUF2147 domain-containing protein n=1 Tax=Aquiflexum lacus TaxID=2483805 RepID=UPI0018962F7B|nr:DUF2147 domain-containing protein [Aquiflexum lacus]